VAPTGSVTLPGETTMAIPGTLTIAAATFPLVTEVAVTETVKSPKLGGVYVVGAPLGVAVGDTLPHDGLFTYAPETADMHEMLQVTPAFAASCVTVAVNCAVFPGWTVADAGETDTLAGPSGTVMGENADSAPSATEAAVIVTLSVAEVLARAL